MKIAVRVKPNSKEEKVEKVSDNEYVVRIKAPAKEGRANEAAIEALGEYFDIPKSRISILKGLTGRNKVVSIE